MADRSLWVLLLFLRPSFFVSDKCFLSHIQLHGLPLFFVDLLSMFNILACCSCSSYSFTNCLNYSSILSLLIFLLLLQRLPCVPFSSSMDTFKEVFRCRHTSSCSHPFFSLLLLPPYSRLCCHLPWWSQMCDWFFPSPCSTNSSSLLPWLLFSLQVAGRPPPGLTLAGLKAVIRLTYWFTSGNFRAQLLIVTRLL